MHILQESNRRYDIFVSYSRKDNNQHRVQVGDQEMGWVEAFVERLNRRHAIFTGNELNIFFDQKSILNDEYWVDKLRVGVRDSILFVAFLSPNYLESPYCRKEWEDYLWSLSKNKALHTLMDCK